MLGLPFLGAFVMVIFMDLWGFAFITSIMSMYLSNATSATYTPPSNGLVFVCCLYYVFSYYWFAQVVRNVVHVSCSGVYATWYFLGGDNAQMPANPTLGAFKRAMTTSFGSVCFGSLIVALIQTLRWVVRVFKRACGPLACILECILICIEGIVRYFNRYAYAQVAIYGKTFCEAARDTWDLFGREGMHMIVNDDLIGNVFMIGILLIALLTGGGALGIAYAALSGPDTSDATGINIALLYAVLFGIVGLCIAASTAGSIMSVVDSGVATIFVCFAMDKFALQRNSPELFQKFSEANARTP